MVFWCLNHGIKEVEEYRPVNISPFNLEHIFKTKDKRVLENLGMFLYKVRKKRGVKIKARAIRIEGGGGRGVEV